MAQRDTYALALAGLRAGHKRAGHKRGHWMWFAFPQVAGLGHSATAARYAIGSREEAIAFLAHPVLGPRLRTGAEDPATTAVQAAWAAGPPASTADR